MLGGGIASPTDRIDSAQFAEDEIAAAVEEATNANIYVTGHAYTPASIARALRLGVRCIEHGTLLDDATAELFVQNDAFLVPTLAIGALLASAESADFGVPEASRVTAEGVAAAGVRMLGIARERGVRTVFGTDFIGDMQQFQSREFAVRAEVLSPLEILRSGPDREVARMLQSVLLLQAAPGRLDRLVEEYRRARVIEAAVPFGLVRGEALCVAGRPGRLVVTSLWPDRAAYESWLAAAERVLERVILVVGGSGRSPRRQ